MLNSVVGARIKARREELGFNQEVVARHLGFKDRQILSNIETGERKVSADELLRAKNWGVHVSLPAEFALKPTLARDIVKRFRVAAPLVDALNGAILEGAARASSGGAERGRDVRRPLF